MEETLGQRLRKLREEWGETQETVARLTGINRSNLANYETDVRKPRIEQLQKLADFYGVSSTYLLTGSEVYDKPEYTPNTQILLQTLRGASEKEIDENTTYCKGYQIFETDKGSELSDFTLKKSSEFDIFGWGPLDYTPSSTLLDTGSEWRETNISGVKKGVNTLAGEYSPKKRYVLLLPFYESDSTEWVNIPEQAVIVDTKKNSELKTVLKIAVGDYETTIKLK